MDFLAKRSLKRSVKVPSTKLKSSLDSVKDRAGWKKRGLWDKHGMKRSHHRGGGRGGCTQGGGDRERQGAGTRRGSGGMDGPSGWVPTKDPSFMRSYQADLESERVIKEEAHAQKNAERATMRVHFRKKFKLSKNIKDTSHLRAVRGKVKLPPELAKMVHSEKKSKDNRFGLSREFQGLNIRVFTRSKERKTPTSTATNRGGHVMSRDKHQFKH